MKVPAKIGQKMRCSDLPPCFLCDTIRKRGKTRSLIQIRLDKHSPAFFICDRCAFAGSSAAVRNAIKIKFLRLQAEANK